MSSSVLINAILGILKQEKRDVPTNMQRVNLKDADQSGANLQCAKLIGANLNNTNFTNTNLTNVNFLWQL